jgi:esterase/lipase
MNKNNQVFQNYFSLLLLFTIIFSKNSYSQIIDDNFSSKYVARINETYKKNSEKFTKLSVENSPSFEKANSKTSNQEVTYLLHGFMGTPFEMKEIGMEFKKNGSDLFNDLIMGHGDSAEISNQFDRSVWSLQSEENLNLLFSQYKKVNLVGFSTGGLLISQYLLNHPENRAKVKQVILLSPFYFPHLSFAPIFGKFLKLFMSKLDVKLFYKLTAYPDVEVITMVPNFYMQDIPINTAIEIATLADEFVKKTNIQTDIPKIDIFLTEKDEVLSFDKTLPFVKTIYPNATIHEYKTGHYPHHLMSSYVSDAVLDIKKTILKNEK